MMDREAVIPNFPIMARTVFTMKSPGGIWKTMRNGGRAHRNPRGRLVHTDCWGWRWWAGTQSHPLPGTPAARFCESGWEWTGWWCERASPPDRRSSASSRCSFQSQRCWGTGRSRRGRWQTWKTEKAAFQDSCSTWRHQMCLFKGKRHKNLVPARLPSDWNWRHLSCSSTNH